MKGPRAGPQALFWEQTEPLTLIDRLVISRQRICSALPLWLGLTELANWSDVMVAAVLRR